MKTSWIALCAVFLVGCHGGSGSRETPPPVQAQCEETQCRNPCVSEDGDTGIRWDGSPTDPAAFDALVDDVVEPLVEKLRQCEVRRKACEQCLDRLREAGVIL
jgi:hypothetical protein